MDPGNVRGSGMGPINCYLKGCTKCGGDLIYDVGDWKCVQCGQYYYPVGPGSFEELPSKSVERERPLDGNNHVSLPGPAEPADGAPRRQGPKEHKCDGQGQAVKR